MRYYEFPPSSTIFIGDYTTFLLLLQQENFSFVFAFVIIAFSVVLGKSAVHEASFGGHWVWAQWVELELDVYEGYTYTRDFFISD